MATGATWAPGPFWGGIGMATSATWVSLGPRALRLLDHRARDQWTRAREHSTEPMREPVDRDHGGTSVPGPGPCPLVHPWSLSTGPPMGLVHWYPLGPCPLVPPGSLSTGPPMVPVHWTPHGPGPLVPGPSALRPNGPRALGPMSCGACCHTNPAPQGPKGPMWRLLPFQSCPRRALGPMCRLFPFHSRPKCARRLFPFQNRPKRAL